MLHHLFVGHSFEQHSSSSSSSSLSLSSLSTKLSAPRDGVLKKMATRTKMGLKREEGFIIQKLRKTRAARTSSSCCSTTPPPIWRLKASSSQHHRDSLPEFLLDFPTTMVSARKLCAFLWHILPHQMAPPHRHKSFQLPASASSLRERVAASFAQHHRYEAAQCNCEVTPASSLDIKGRIQESSCNLKTSRELLKVLNRIQSIREQHASNVPVVKGLKVELDHSRAQIKELRREKQMAEDKFVRKKNYANDRHKVAVQSAEEELEDERRHSENLHWRLSQELSEVKSLFYGSLRELERERERRILLENLCDEFAIRIRDYQQESEKNADRDNHYDRLILDISKSWLDERMQMKVDKAGDDLVEINSVVDKLGFDIETFLRAKRSVNLRKYGNSSPKEIREIHPCQYNSSDNTGLNNETEVSTVYEETEQVTPESDHRPLIRRLDSSHRNSENKCRGDSCVYSVVRSNVSAVKQGKLKCSKGEKEGTLKEKLLEARFDGNKSGSVAAGKSCL